MQKILHRSRMAGAEEGFSLLEVIIAMFVFSVAVLALASVTLTSLLSLRQTRDREQATNAASAVIEEVRARDFEHIFLDAGSPDVTALNGCHDGEPIAADAPSAVAGITAVPFRQTSGNNGVITVTTYVTYAQEDDASPDSCSVKEQDPLATPDPAPSEVVELDVKRVVAVAEWQDGDQVEQVVQETLITSTGRGLPVPDFELAPNAGSVAVHKDEVDSAEEVCARHQLRNLGAEDTYDWELVKVEGDVSGGGTKADSTDYYTPNQKWRVRAYMQYPATSVSLSPPDPASDNTTVLMTDFDGNPTRPESGLTVPSGESANVWFCYEASDTSLTVGATITATVAMYSRFDGDRTEKVQSTLTVTDEESWFYLYDRVDNIAHPRDSDADATDTVYPTMVFGEEDGIPGSSSNLGTIDYTDPTLSDWDTDVDADLQPGLRLIRGHSDLRQAAWHHNFLSAATLEQAATLRLWMATPEALAGNITADPVTHKSQSFQVTLSRLYSQETLPGDELYSAGVSYSHASSGWLQLDIPVDFGGPVTFDDNEYLRLQITCASASDSDCVLAYDNTAFPSGLQIGVR